MEKRDARLFQPEARSVHSGWNVVELESRRHLRYTVNELIELATYSTITTSEMQQRLHDSVNRFGGHFATHLVHSLYHDDPSERQSVVWLLTLLNDQDTIPQLERIALNTQLSRPVRLSASLALAGMGATREVRESPRRVRLYAMS